MIGGWAQRAFHMSFDGREILSHRFDGVELVQKGGGNKVYQAAFLHGYRYIQWGPDNRRFLFWSNKGISVGDVSQLNRADCELPFSVIYKAPAGRTPFGVSWSPTGQSVYISEHYIEEQPPVGGKPQPTLRGTAIKKVPASGGNPREILKHPVTIKWFCAPITRFEDGSGPKGGGYKIAVGAVDGLYLMDPDGSDKVKLVDMSPDGAQDVLWSPEKDYFALLYRRPGRMGQTELKGLYLVHAGKKGKKPEEIVENVHPELEIHTVYFSHKGRYLSWATHGGAYVKDLEPDPKNPKAGEPIKIDLKAEKPLEVKGCAFSQDDTRLAVAAGNRLYVYDLAKKTVTQVAKTGDDAKSFVAEPMWRGNEIVFSTFTNVAAKRRKPEPKPLPDKK